MIKEIIDELNKENGANYKIEVLEKYLDNNLLKLVLGMTYDNVRYTYGLTMKNVALPTEYSGTITLGEGLRLLTEEFVTRNTTGNEAIKLMEETLGQLNSEDAGVLMKVLDRDLKINMGRSQINKVHKNLIIKPPYMRCGLYTPKTLEKINFPAFVQLKADGMFQTASVINGSVTFTSRSGEEREFPDLAKEFSGMPDGIYIGELLVRGTKTRTESNGLLNSDNPPQDKIFIQLWDYVTHDEYSRPKDKEKKIPYQYRLAKLKININKNKPKNIEIIPTHKVKDIQAALVIVSEWMASGMEGGVLKDTGNIFLDHTSPTQLKIKLVIDAEVRCTGFYEGKRGTKRVKTFGGITYQTDDGKIQGRTSGFTDKQLKDFNSRRTELVGEIFTIQFNDITKARDAQTYALSHPRFIEFRSDRDKTDTFERIQDMKKMAMEVGDRKT